MSERVTNDQQEHVKKNISPTFQVRLPGFLVAQEVGLGDMIKRATSAIGIKPCGGCQQRAAALNHWMTFSGRR